MIFQRDARPLDGKSGNLPTAADLGTLVALDDDQTVKATTASDDVEVRLIEIEGTQYWVEPA